MHCIQNLMAATFCVAAVSLYAANGRITSEGDYPPHLQGVCTDGTNIWWSHTVELTRTDLKGKVLAHAKGLKAHHGDLCVVGGTVYVAVNHGQFNTEDKADSWVYAYRGDDLSFIKRWKVPELCHGAGGMTWKDGHFFVIGGLPPTLDENYVYEYTPEFTFVKRHVLNSGWTNRGIQTVDCSEGKFYFGCYGGTRKADGKTVPALTLVSTDLSHVEKRKVSTNVGIIRLNGQLWRASMKALDEAAPRNRKRYRKRYRTWLEPIPAKSI